jgi:hypothetical protein
VEEVLSHDVVRPGQPPARLREAFDR